MKQTAPRRSFSLVEILVASVVIGLGIVAVSAALVAGKYFLKRSENDATAMSLAVAKKESLLAKSYSSLPVANSTGQEGIFVWHANVTQAQECNTAVTPEKCIPYKEIAVEVSYPEVKRSSLPPFRRKKVILRNRIVYPFVHLRQALIDVTCNTAVCRVTQTDKVVGDNTASLSLSVDFPVDKDVLLIYNIALDIENAAGILESDTIFSQCFVNGVGTGLQARTPITSQPLINNIIEIDNLQRRNPGSPHTIEIRWRKDTPQGVISIKRANLILVAFER